MAVILVVWVADARLARLAGPSSGYSCCLVCEAVRPCILALARRILGGARALMDGAAATDSGRASARPDKLAGSLYAVYYVLPIGFQSGQFMNQMVRILEINVPAMKFRLVSFGEPIGIPLVSPPL